ncbi:hypothetical protein ACLOJK_015073, partial [Asimina triloba]
MTPQPMAIRTQKKNPAACQIVQPFLHPSLTQNHQRATQIHPSKPPLRSPVQQQAENRVRIDPNRVRPTGQQRVRWEAEENDNPILPGDPIFSSCLGPRQASTRQQNHRNRS